MSIDNKLMNLNTELAGFGCKEVSVRDLHGGKQIHVTFNNSRGASVVCHRYSCGFEDGLFELAILDKDGDIDYSTDIANDVIGCLTAAEAIELLRKISKL